MFEHTVPKGLGVHHCHGGGMASSSHGGSNREPRALVFNTSRKQRAVSELSKEFALYDTLSLPQCHTFCNKVTPNELPSFSNWGLSI